MGVPRMICRAYPISENNHHGLLLWTAEMHKYHSLITMTSFYVRNPMLEPAAKAKVCHHQLKIEISNWDDGLSMAQLTVKMSRLM